jgi:hypothetical protein
MFVVKYYFKILLEYGIQNIPTSRDFAFGSAFAAGMQANAGVRIQEALPHGRRLPINPRRAPDWSG